MNALLVICGLGFVSLLAEIANFKKLLTALVVLALVAAIVLGILDWGTPRAYYHDMVVFDNFSLAFTALLCTITLAWYVMARSYFEHQSHQSDRSALMIFARSAPTLLSVARTERMGRTMVTIFLYD